MYLDAGTIKDDSFITEIVTQDYRTSDVFLKYGIDYCCNGKSTLRAACELKGVDVEQVKQQLNEAVSSVNSSSSLEFNQWPIDFLIDYIEYVHHHYLKKNLSLIEDTLKKLIVSYKIKNT